MPAAWSWELSESWPVGPGWGCRPSDARPGRPSLHSGQDGCRVEYINVRPEGPLALVLPLPHWSLPPTLGRHLLLLTNPHVLPAAPPITPSLRRASFGKRRPG